MPTVADTWPVMLRAASDRRHELLDALPLENLHRAVVLDFGCGPWGFGSAFPKLAECRFALGMDFSEGFLAESERISGTGRFAYGANYAYAATTGEQLKLDTSSADIIFANESLDRVPNTDLLLDEFHRVLAPAGQLALALGNTDAYPYRMRGEPYVPGADRPGAMSYGELEAHLRPRFDLLAAHGYNRTFHDELDAELHDEDFARAWAGLYPHRPDLGSGVVVLARKRAGYIACGYRQDKLAYSSSRAVYEGDWADRPIGGGLLARMGTAGASVRFDIVGETLLLILWSHPWSGHAAIEVDGKPAEDVDLYARVPGFRRVTLAGLRAGSHAVRLTATGERHPRAQGDELLFRQAIGYQRP